MFIGLGINLARPMGGGVAAFSPASLSPDAWYDPSDLSSLFQNSNGTGAVTADGDPVGYMADKSGNGNHLLQVTAGNRPLYKTAGGLHWLLFDGVDDFMLDTFTVTSPIDRISGIRALAWADAATFYSDPSNGTAMMLNQRVATPSVYISSPSNAAPVSMTLNSDFVVTERHNGASSSLQLDDAAAQTGDPGSTLPTGLLFGSRFNAGQNPANFRFYGMAQKSGTLTADEKASLKTWMAAKQGRVL